MTEEKMVGWQHQFNGHELGQTLGDGEGQGNLVCCSPWNIQHPEWCGAALETLDDEEFLP